MTLNRVKLGRAVYFYEMACQRSLFDISSENFKME